MPNQDATSKVPSWASMSSASPGASGLPLASMTSGTSCFASSSGITAVTPRLVANPRRHANGSPHKGRWPKRCKRRAVSSPRTPAPSTMTRSRYPGPGVQRHLQCRLHWREQRRRRGVHGRQGNQVTGPRCEYILMRLKGEDRPVPVLDFADAGIAVRKGVAEGTAERVDRVVQREPLRELTAVDQPLSAAADAREQGGDDNLAGAGPRRGHFPDPNAARRGVEQCAGGHAGQPAGGRFAKWSWTPGPPDVQLKVADSV